ncbi:hypothetical protein ACNQ2T_01860 [Mycoplasma sp. Z407A]|uniref:hypothetical protein n=1 Tax=Mycoplasma sp. Z407A TaxID=3401678 RepID=UPI003AB00CCD
MIVNYEINEQIEKKEIQRLSSVQLKELSEIINEKNYIDRTVTILSKMDNLQISNWLYIYDTLDSILNVDIFKNSKLYKTIEELLDGNRINANERTFSSDDVDAYNKLHAIYEFLKVLGEKEGKNLEKEKEELNKKIALAASVSAASTATASAFVSWIPIVNIIVPIVGTISTAASSYALSSERDKKAQKAIEIRDSISRMSIRLAEFNNAWAQYNIDPDSDVWDRIWAATCMFDHLWKMKESLDGIMKELNFLKNEIGNNTKYFDDEISLINEFKKRIDNESKWLYALIGHLINTKYSSY